MGKIEHLVSYTHDVPWYGLARKINPNHTPKQMLQATGLDWKVEKQDIYLANGNILNQKALVRSDTSDVLTIVGEDWNAVQNIEAFEFFNDFVKTGDMEMYTAGELKGGRMVWALAKVKESFKIFGVDQIDSYLLFSNPHELGKCIDVNFVASRAVCYNTMTYALDQRAKQRVRFHHKVKFDRSTVKETLIFGKERMQQYKQNALFLGSKYYTKDSLAMYFNKVFPKTATREESLRKREISHNAKRAMDLIHTQPGSGFAEGTYWQAFNAILFMIDHVVGTDDNRLYSAWYGPGKAKKERALQYALELARVA